MKYGLFLPLLVLVEGCALPPVNLATPKPMQVDIKMRVDVYQYASQNASTEKKDAKESEKEILRSNRQADIQSFKNAQYVGEDHEGLLRMRYEPSGDLRNRVRKVVEAENADRSAEMQAIAQKEKIPLSEIQARQGQVNQLRAFKGEWVEIARPDGTIIWVRKES
jgi:uncharacterized protein YdbL (DUF1318 family)